MDEPRDVINDNTFDRWCPDMGICPWCGLVITTGPSRDFCIHCKKPVCWIGHILGIL